jgi:hypothetical protein
VGAAEPSLIAGAVTAALRQQASPIVADATPNTGPANAAARNTTRKQSIRSSANFLRNTPAVARKSHVHPLVQKAFTNETFDHTPLFTGLQGQD